MTSVYPNYGLADDQCQEVILKPGDFNGLIGFFPPHLMPVNPGAGPPPPGGKHLWIWIWGSCNQF